jgi:hypothetical protein
MNDYKLKKQSEHASGNKGALFWMLLPVILLVVSSTGWLIMVSIAVDDPGFAVESDYYKKASNYDEVISQRGANERLGWRVTVDAFEISADGNVSLAVALKDAQGAALAGAEVRVEAFHNARAGQIQDVVLTEGTVGVYRTSLKQPRVGLWELRVFAKRGELFTQVLRTELSTKVAGEPPS